MDSYALKLGTVTQPVLDADADAFLVNWQALVTAGNPTAISDVWNVQTSNEVEYSTQRVYNVNGRARNLGDAVIASWELILSTDMAVYLEATIFSGGPDALVTIKTYDQYEGVWDAYNCRVERPRMVGRVFDPVNDVWFRRFRLDFFNATLAAAS